MTLIYAAGYENLIESCRELAANQGLREELEKLSLATIKRLPQKDLLSSLLV